MRHFFNGRAIQRIIDANPELLEIHSSKIEFNEASGCTIAIETAHTHITSVTMDDLDGYDALFNAPLTMEKYSNGQPRPRSATETRLQGWVDRLQNNDPFNALAVRLKGNDEIVGHVILGSGDIKGQSELGALMNPIHGNQNYSIEVANAVLHHLAPTLKEQGQLVRLCTPDGEEDEYHPLKSVCITTSVTNHAMTSLLNYFLGEEFKAPARLQVNEMDGPQKHMWIAPVHSHPVPVCT